MAEVTTLHYVFKRLNVVAFEVEPQRWAAQTLDAGTSCWVHARASVGSTQVWWRSSPPLGQRAARSGG